MTTHQSFDLPSGLGVRYHHVRNYRPFTGPLKFSALGSYQTTHVDPRGGQTVAQIIDLDTEVVVAEGVARCHTKDNYNKAIGRRIALGRAVKALANRKSAFDLAETSEDRIRAAVHDKIQVGFLYWPLGEFRQKYYEGLPLKVVTFSRGQAAQVKCDDTIKSFYLSRISDVARID